MGARLIEIVKRFGKKGFRFATNRFGILESRGLSRIARIAVQFRVLGVGAIVTALAGAVLDVSSIAIIGLAITFLSGDINNTLTVLPEILRESFSPIVEGQPASHIFAGLIAAAVILQIFRSCLMYLNTLVGGYLVASINKEIVLKFTKEILKAPYAIIQQYQTGALGVITAQAKAYTSIAKICLDVIVLACIALVYIAVVWRIMPIMALILPLFGVAIWISINGISKKIKQRTSKGVKLEIEIGRRSTEYYSTPRLIRIFNADDTTLEKIGGYHKRLIELQRSTNMIEAMLIPAIEVATIVGIASVLLVGVFFFGQTTATSLTKWYILIMIIVRAKPYLVQLNQTRLRADRHLPVIAQVERLFQKVEKIRIVPNQVSITNFSDKLTFLDVNFIYPDGTKALNDVSFSLRKGNTLALVGPSGGGKSTIADLIMGLYQPTSGQILIDGIDLSCIEIKAWRELIGVVEQEIFLLNASIRENVLFGRNNIGENDVDRALHISHAHDFVGRLKNGADTEIGERGYQLSGGQRQRLALARAVVGSPKVLILDEATSALDVVSEKILHQTMSEMKEEITILLIAHRYSTLSMADEIIVVDRGRIIERGTKDDLLSKAGMFAEAWGLQSSALQ